MKTHLLFLLLFCFSNSINLFAQCYGSGGRSSGGWGFRGSRDRVEVIDTSPVEKFKSWQKSVPSNSSLLVNWGYQQTQWHLNSEGISKSKIVSEFSIDFGWGFYLGKK